MTKTAIVAKTARQEFREIAEGVAKADEDGLERLMAAWDSREDAVTHARHEFEDAKARVTEDPDAEALVEDLIFALAMEALPPIEREEARLEALGPLLDAYCLHCGSVRGRSCQCQ